MIEIALSLLLAIGTQAEAETGAAPDPDYPYLPELGAAAPRPWDRYQRRVSLARSLYLECAGNVADRLREQGSNAGAANSRAVLECQHEFVAYERAYRLLSAASGKADENEIQRALDVAQVDRWEAIQSFFH